MNIRETKDTALLAALGKMMQDNHQKLYPAFFKDYHYETIKAYLDEVFQNPKETAFLWQEAEQVAGYLWLGIEALPETAYRLGYKRLYIHHIAVMPEFQGRGLSKEMLAFADEYAEKNQIDVVELHYWPKNQLAKETYLKQGFVPYQEIAQKQLDKKIP